MGCSSARKSEQFPVAPRGGTDIATILDKYSASSNLGTPLQKPTETCVVYSALKLLLLRGLSTSEVFHEPPKMYVYTERPPQQYPIRKVSQPATIAAFVKKRKHTLCAWAFGIVAISLITTIIVLQMSGSLG
ncbi:unnamed protein product [Heligmosomoides polygyrus]|uniref:LEM domain-containing protein n=1 Tax=Heligmosomoides polygyrus TaxID=6339 RepID=A0A183GGU3_HELPZ|nr:unnamed protein product [Heligmosomoides polygyrus]